MAGEDHRTLTAPGASETIPSLGEGPVSWGRPSGKAFSPGNQEECSDGAAMPVTGNEDRVIGHLPHIDHSVSSPIPSFDRGRN